MNQTTWIQTRLTRGHRFLILLLSLGGVVFMSLPADAHHPLNGRLPSNAFEGFMSGFAHPLIGLDHFAFVIAAGLAGVLFRRGFVIPVAFVVASLGGTGLHLRAIDLPLPELIIAMSVFSFGMFIAFGRQLNLKMLAILGAIAGIFHGYAYGEAIVGAEMSSLYAYLIGFSSVQLGISLGAWSLGQSQLKQNRQAGLLRVRFIGCGILGAGVTLLSGLLMG